MWKLPIVIYLLRILYVDRKNDIVPFSGVRPSNGDWEVVGEKLTKPEFIVSNLQPSQTYTFIAVAENKFGMSDYTDALVVPSRAGRS